MTKEILIILDDLLRKESTKTLTPAETETLEELLERFKSEWGSWHADGVAVLRATIKEMAAINEERSEDRYLVMAGELMLAGWTSEEANPGYESRTMSLYWRRPPRRKDLKGMLFRSTYQAYRHMQKMQASSGH
jgi:hypothetical protein